MYIYIDPSTQLQARTHPLQDKLLNVAVILNQPVSHTRLNWKRLKPQLNKQDLTESFNSCWLNKKKTSIPPSSTDCLQISGRMTTTHHYEKQLSFNHSRYFMIPRNICILLELNITLLMLLDFIFLLLVFHKFLEPNTCLIFRMGSNVCDGFIGHY